MSNDINTSSMMLQMRAMQDMAASKVLVKQDTINNEMVEGVATDLNLKKVRYASNATKPVSPKDHPVIPPSGLNDEELKTLGLIEEEGEHP